MAFISSKIINPIISTPAVVPTRALSVLQEEYTLWLNFMDGRMSFGKTRCTDSPYCTGLVGDRYCCNCEGEFLDEMERKEAARYAAVHGNVLDERASESKGKKSKSKK